MRKRERLTPRCPTIGRIPTRLDAHEALSPTAAVDWPHTEPPPTLRFPARRLPLAPTIAERQVSRVNQFGKLLIVLGAVIALAGAVLLLGDKLGLGRLPGDLVLRGKNTTFHFPVVSSIVVSIVLTILLNLWLRGRG